MIQNWFRENIGSTSLFLRRLDQTYFLLNETLIFLTILDSFEWKDRGLNSWSNGENFIKKELYFVRYSISKFKDFSKIFLEFFLNFYGLFQFWAYLWKYHSDFWNRNLRKYHSNFWNKNLQKCPSDFLSKKLLKCPSHLLIFLKSEIYRNATLHYLNQRLGFL